MSESQGAKLSCRTLRSSAVAGCNVQVSHPAMFFLTILRKSGGKGKVDANVLGVSGMDRASVKKRTLAWTGKTWTSPESGRGDT